jgi:hypothetical protein
MNLYNIAFTGHRDVLAKDDSAIERGLRNLELMGWVRKQPIHFHTGGAPGFDSRVFKRLGFHDSAINTLHIPFEYQWLALQEYLGLPGIEIETYMAPLCKACGPKKDYVRPTDNYLYQKRNEHMVDVADLLVTYFNGQPSGTKNCIDYAKKKGVEIVDIREL